LQFTSSGREAEDQIADEVNYNVHETLASDNGSRHGDYSETSQHLTFSILLFDFEVY